MKKTSRSIIILAALTILLPCTRGHAEVKTITVTHTYNMGDNDSRNDARSICFLEAKRKALEQAGTYMESKTEVKNYMLSRDEIFAYSAALLKVETINELWRDMSVSLTVRADIDTGYMLKKLDAISKDRAVQNEIKTQQAQIKNLENAVESLRSQLNSTDNKTALVLRKERNIVVKEINEQETRKAEIVERIQTKSTNASKFITRGMTKNDVRALLGEPDGKDSISYHYGITKVSFNSGGVVDGITPEYQETNPEWEYYKKMFYDYNEAVKEEKRKKYEKLNAEYEKRKAADKQQ